MDIAQIASRLQKDEGWRPSAYQDTRGYWTIGNGFCIDARVGGVLPEPVRAFWLEYLIQDTLAKLADFPSLAHLDDVRLQLMVCLLYSMGKSRLSEFRNMLGDVSRGDYDSAADQLVNSLWYKQVGVRGPIYVRILRKGVWE